MNTLLKTALVGTTRSGSAESLEPHPTDELLDQVHSGSREDRLLLAAGLRSIFDQAGQCGHRLPEVTVEPAPEDDGTPCSSELQALLKNSFATGTHELLPEFLAHMAAADLRLPHALLPQALHTRDPRLRELLRPVLGARGRWLSQFREEWGWVSAGAWSLPEAEEAALHGRFLEATVSERCEILARVHATRPETAIGWLEEIWQQEKADVRRQLLESVADTTGPSDEPFLEQALTDRSGHVRSVASRLLSRLEDSQLARRMRDRGAQLLQRDPQQAPLRLKCIPPTELPASWKRDGIAEKAPRGVGRRAFWTETVLKAVPPSHWSRGFDADPQTLIDATEGDPFALSVIRGWTDAACTFAPTPADDRTAAPELAAWLPALFRFWVQHAAGRSSETAMQSTRETLTALLQAMSTEQAEACLLESWQGQRWRESVVPPQLVAELPIPWSENFATRYLKFLQRILRHETGNLAHQWANTLHTAARCLPPACFSAATRNWDIPASGAGAWQTRSVAREIEQFSETVRLRRKFFEEIRQ